jgi:hypothetical protein
MNYILNADELLYYSLEDFIEALDNGETGDQYYVLFAHEIEPLFEKIKRRTALRGKLAKDDKGALQTENFQITEDERDVFLEFLQDRASKIFKSISGYSKLINSAFRFNVRFGDPEFSSTVTSVDPTGLIITDNTLDMEVNAYAGMKLVIISPGLMENKEATILYNTEDTFTIQEEFDGDVTDLEYIVTAQTNNYILIYSNFDVTKFDTNVLLGMDSLFEKCYIDAVLADWYLANRFMDDYTIEEKLLKDDISELRMHYFHSMSPYRAKPFFNDNDISDVTLP